jgi:hypothetical protein
MPNLAHFARRRRDCSFRSDLVFPGEIGFLAEKSTFDLGRWNIGFRLMVVMDFAVVDATPAR